MKTLLIILLALLVCRTSRATPSPEKIKELLQQCVEKQHRAPGIVVGLIDKNGVTILPCGKFDEDASENVHGDTLFEIGSITKVFTSLVLQDMADRGEVQLDDPIAKYLPPSVTVPSRNNRQITLRSLATHSSGLPRLPENLVPKDENNPYADYTVEQMYAFLSSYKLPRDVGAKSEYSNFGMGLLGHILALKAGTSYETLVVNRVCAPLQMDSTRITLTPRLQTRLSPGHDEAGTRASNWDLPTLAGAGALRSSARDLLKLLAAEMGLAASPLSKAMDETQKPQKDKGFLSQIGLGWQLDNRHGTLWHNGGTGGYRSYMGFKKDKSLGVVVLANSANDVDDIGQYILGARRNPDVTPRRRIAKIDYAVYDHYVGQYKFPDTSGVLLTVTRKGDHLFAQLTGQESFEVFPESKSDFFLTVVDAQLTFETDDSGKTIDVVLHQNGIDQTATKIK